MIAQKTNTSFEQKIQDLLALSITKKESGDIKESSRYLNEAASLEWELRNYEKAIEYYQESIKLNEKIGNQAGILSIYSNLGLIYADKQEYEKSFFYFEKVLVSRKKNKEEGLRSSLINIAVITNKLEKYNQSIDYLEEALMLAREKYDLKDMRLCYGMIYEIYTKMGNLEKASQYFYLYRDVNNMLVKKTEDKANKFDDIKKENEKLNKEYKILEEEKRNKALELDKLAKELEEEEKKLQETNQAIKNISEIYTKEQIAFKYYKAEQENKQLKISNEKTLAELERNKYKYRLDSANNRIYIALAFIITLIVSGIVLIKLYIDRKKQNKKLAEQRDELNELNRVKDKLFSIIAHDLRSPMIALHNFSTLLDMGDLLPEEQKFLLENVRKTSSNTLETLDILLQWAKSQMAGIIPSPTQINIYELVEKQVRYFQTNIINKNITLINEVKKDDVAFADRNQIDTVLRNLVNNAIKFTHKGGTITIKSENTNEKLYIGVQDTGIGIPEENIPKILDDKQNFTTQGTDKEKGTGLGLSLCKEFIEANQGKINIKSKINEGTLVSFSLPIKK
jgi:signal transduction histidine kinase